MEQNKKKSKFLSLFMYVIVFIVAIFLGVNYFSNKREASSPNKEPLVTTAKQEEEKTPENEIVNDNKEEINEQATKNDTYTPSKVLPIIACEAEGKTKKEARQECIQNAFKSGELNDLLDAMDDDDSLAITHIGADDSFLQWYKQTGDKIEKMITVAQIKWSGTLSEGSKETATVTPTTEPTKEPEKETSQVTNSPDTPFSKVTYNEGISLFKGDFSGASNYIDLQAIKAISGLKVDETSNSFNLVFNMPSTIKYPYQGKTDDITYTYNDYYSGNYFKCSLGNYASSASSMVQTNYAKQSMRDNGDGTKSLIYENAVVEWNNSKNITLSDSDISELLSFASDVRNYTVEQIDNLLILKHNEYKWITIIDTRNNVAISANTGSYATTSLMYQYTYYDGNSRMAIAFHDNNVSIINMATKQEYTTSGSAGTYTYDEYGLLDLIIAKKW